MNSIMSYDNFLNEKKFLSTLYHYTKPKYLEMILDEDQMLSGHKYISFSRNHDLKIWYRDYLAFCRISFDGESMSDKFKITPHLFDPAKDELFGGGTPMDYKTRKMAYGTEWEERIMGERIKGVKRYIIQVDILAEYIEDDAHARKIIERTIAKHPDVQINFVTSFRPVKIQ